MTRTATIRLKALWGLRIHGPCSISDLADRTGLDRQAVYSAVYKLRQEGLAEHRGPASYDVTEQGRAFLQALPDQVEPPPPVRQLDLFD
jgi:predicted transcriptional regulator